MSRTVLRIATLLLTTAAFAQTPEPRVPPIHLSHAPRAVELTPPTPGTHDAELTVQTIDGPIILDLHLAPLRASDAAAYIDDGSGHLTQVPLPPSGTFQGSVRGQPRSIVAAALIRGGLRAIIDLDSADPSDAQLVIQPAADFAMGPGHVMFATTELEPGDWHCGVTATPPAITGTYGERACDRIAEIAFDADYEMFVANGSSANATIADIESVMIANDVIYSRDVGISHQATAFIIRTTPVNPYTSTNAGGLLDQFRNEWQVNQSLIRRDMAHLMTGKEIDGNVIGVAWVSAVCTSYAYGLSQTLFTAELPYRTGLTAHEMGHNWGAGHCDADADCSIMCSGINGCAHNVTSFSPNSITAIASYRNSASCLSSGTPVAFDDFAQTLVGQPVRIDVLANDSPANCGSILLVSSATTTPGGNTVSRSIGTGPGGRDELLFTPCAGYSGEDRISYTIRNAASVGVTGNARVNVIVPRAAQFPSLSSPGLDADYYYTLPASVTDIPRGTPSGSAVAATINFPSSDANIGGGTRHDGVGMILTGTIQIPVTGTYTFYSESDDGSVVYVNNSLVVMNDGPQVMSEVGGSIALPAGPASVRVEYVQVNGTAGLILRIAGPGTAKQVVPESWWTAPGVAISFFNCGDTYSDLPNFASLPLVRSGTLTSVNQANFTNYLGAATRRTNIAAVITGYLVVPTTGFYTLSTTSDDASILSIGSRLVVSNRGAHGMVERSGSIALAAGAHPIRIEFWQGGGGGGLIASIEGPGISKQPIPASMLIRALPDCDQNAIDDRTETTKALDLGDIALGGNGLGTAAVGSGLVPSSAIKVTVSQSGGSRASGTAILARPDGINSRPLIPAVAAVFVPNGLSTWASGRTRYQFSNTTGAAFDAIRNGAGIFASPSAPSFSLADQIGIARKGLSMHANSGITFDLNQIRLANPGRTILTAHGIAGLMQDSCAGRDAAGEFYVLLDGSLAFHTVLTDDALAQEFNIPIGSNIQYLTLAMLEASTNNCDHFAVADARLIFDQPADSDFDGILDSCQCVGDFNHDGGVDGSDVGAFFDAWQASAPDADVNRDGGIDGADIERFFAKWQAGLC